MQGSVGYLIWTICYLSVLLGLSAYGVHRYFIIYLFLKHRKRAPAAGLHVSSELPKVTVQLPIFNEVYVVERLLKSVSELDYPRDCLQIQVLDDSTDETRELTAACVCASCKARGLNVELIQRTDRSRVQSRRAGDWAGHRAKASSSASWTRISSRSRICSSERSISSPTRRSG